MSSHCTPNPQQPAADRSKCHKSSHLPTYSKQKISLSTCNTYSHRHIAEQRTFSIRPRPYPRDDSRLLMHSHSCTPLTHHRTNTSSRYTCEPQLLIHQNSSRPAPSAAHHPPLMTQAPRTAGMKAAASWGRAEPARTPRRGRQHRHAAGRAGAPKRGR